MFFPNCTRNHTITYTYYTIVYRYANMSELLRAARAGNVQEVKRLIESGADANGRSLYKNLRNETPLHVAASSGSLEMVKYLVEHGADINCKTTFNHTALHKAVRSGSSEVVQYLVEHGAKVTREDCRGRHTVLWWACDKGNHIIVEYLLQHGAIVDLNTHSPLFVACFQGHTAVVQTLLKYNVDIRKERFLGCDNDEIINILKHELKRSIKHREKIEILKTMDEENMIKVIFLRMISFYNVQDVSIFPNLLIKLVMLVY